MTKAELFDIQLQETANLFKVLGHPARLAILKYLAESETCITGDISNELPLSRTTVNQHLAELKNLGLIKGEIEGVKVFYCIDHQKINELWNEAEQFIKDIDSHNDSCNC